MHSSRRFFPAGPGRSDEDDRGISAIVASAVLALTLAAPARAQALCGDVGADGHVTVSDALASLHVVTGGGYHARADMEIDGGADGRVTVTDTLVLLQAIVGGRIVPCAASTSRRLLVATSAIDFANGGIAEIDLETLSVVRHEESLTDGDSVLRLQAGRTLVLNRFAANNLQEIDTSGDLSTTLQCSLGVGANPHDVVMVSETRGYVSRYDKRNLGVIDLGADSTCEDFVTDLIDLSQYADADTIPEMDQMVVVGDRLFIALQLLNRRDFFLPARSGRIAVLDITTDSLVGVIDLEIENPFAETKGLIYHEASDRIYVAGPGNLFTDLSDGGIELIDPGAMTSDGVLMSGAELGGDITDLIVVGTSRAYALVAGEGFVASLVEIDLLTREVIDSLATSAYLFADIEMNELGLLCLADRDPFDPGVRCFDTTDNREVTPEPIYPGLSPFNLVFAP